ncbi:MAG: tetratricopeptide repeat protein, partial [Gallionella sp.]
MPRVLSLLLSGLLLVSPGLSLAGVDEGLAAARRNDYAAALKEFQPLAEQGSAQAQYYLGTLYLNGTGVAQNNAEAVKWITRAAEQGYAPAQADLGLLNYNGEVVTKNDPEAFKWTSKAAE